MHSSEVVALCEANGERDPEPYWRLSLSLPLPALLGSLSPAERQVVARHIAGETHAAIAATRNSSQRTVANQLASSSSKLKGCCRFGLIRAGHVSSAVKMERDRGQSGGFTLA